MCFPILVKFLQYFGMAGVGPELPLQQEITRVEFVPNGKDGHNSLGSQPGC